MKSIELPAGKQTQLFTGVIEQAVAPVCENLFNQLQKMRVAILLDRNLKGLESWSDDMEFFQNVLQRQHRATFKILPESASDDEATPRTFESLCDRLSALTALIAQQDTQNSERLIIATTPKALLEPCPPPDSLRTQEIHLEVGMRIGFRELTDKLNQQLGYDCEAVCETPGQYAVRGGLIDVYPLNGSTPCRVDFFGDEIESIRAFDPTSQRSTKPLLSVVFAPAAGQLDPSPQVSAIDYLPDTVVWCFREPDQLAESCYDIFHSPENIAAPSANFNKVLVQRRARQDHWFGFTAFDNTQYLFPRNTKTIACDTESLETYRTSAYADKTGVERFTSEVESRSAFLRQLLTWQNEKNHIYLVTKNAAEEERLQEILSEDPMLHALKPSYVQGPLNVGFRLAFDTHQPAWHTGSAARGVVVATEAEIYGRNRVRVLGKRRRALPEHQRVDQLLDFAELVDGDYLVHLQNGVCIFRGLQQLEFKGKTEEVISLEFDEGVTLHLRLHESHLLSRYVGLRKSSPKLGRLGTNAWEKSRSGAERATLDFAAELLSMQAQREAEPGFAFSADQHWQTEFEHAFPFNETTDQLRTIQEAKADMEKPLPMDRLVCGDVGFGKTEVALRAAFKAVMDGKQVAVLIPTTVLAQQHFTTFKERMADFPVIVEMLSRFRTAKQRRQILAELAEGKIDILIGTHSLLSKQVLYKDLGLLIIDEEHRFGVKHKEQLKRLKHNLDVLSMSATPIPRTLYFALMGARDLSVIETPPRNRLPIQTIVKSYDTKIVQDAIQFEIDRGGQVFYLHNRVQTIEAVAQRLQELVPDARVGVGHGQMTENTLEKVMLQFVEGKYDVLVCTTIIESGLDIPNCNTLIIEGADRFGLAQLYQLRGRVGRFNRQAYAYLLLHRHTKLLDIAHKRLTAIRQYNKLGAGFRIAMRDLELRGAGNLLGAKQSGHVANVGFDLYCQLLRQSISRLKGEQTALNVRATLNLDFVVVGEKHAAAQGEVPIGYSALKAAEMKHHQIDTIEAYIPPDYIQEARLRIDFYRRFALTTTLDEVSEIAHTLQDRFGRYPRSVDALKKITEIRCLAEQKQIVHVETEGNRLKCRRGNSKTGSFIKVGNRFPRLTTHKPLLRLTEIKKFIQFSALSNP